MNDAGILESVGAFDNLRYNDLPKGRYATFADEDCEFEAHLNMDRIKSVSMLSKDAKSGDHKLYITRFLDDGGATVLSAMLAGSKDGQYEEGAVAYWEKLRNVFGAEWTIK
ncbi:unnamed protein product [Phaeothamnion confervicola]